MCHDGAYHECENLAIAIVGSARYLNRQKKQAARYVFTIDQAPHDEVCGCSNSTRRLLDPPAITALDSSPGNPALLLGQPASPCRTP